MREVTVIFWMTTPPVPKPAWIKTFWTCKSIPASSMQNGSGIPPAVVQKVTFFISQKENMKKRKLYMQPMDEEQVKSATGLCIHLKWEFCWACNQVVLL